MKKKILFITPDYHCSFAYRDELRKLGWKADIYVPHDYPELMLFDTPDYKYKSIKGPKIFKNFHRICWKFFFFFFFVLRYRYHLYYAGIDQFTFGEEKIPFLRKYFPSFRFSLMFSKLFRRKIIFFLQVYLMKKYPI